MLRGICVSLTQLYLHGQSRLMCWCCCPLIECHGSMSSESAPWMWTNSFYDHAKSLVQAWRRCASQCVLLKTHMVTYCQRWNPIPPDMGNADGHSPSLSIRALHKIPKTSFKSLKSRLGSSNSLVFLIADDFNSARFPQAAVTLKSPFPELPRVVF